jgi:hypothetical protein
MLSGCPGEDVKMIKHIGTTALRTPTSGDPWPPANCCHPWNAAVVVVVHVHVHVHFVEIS